MGTPDFSSLALRDGLLKNLASLGYATMTPIQARSLPDILDGKDVIGQAKTGSGKTAAFGLGLLSRLQPERFRIQALVLCPTRELADQVAKEIRRLARQIHNIKVLTLCGGQPIGPQFASLEHGAHIVVGTPGRIDDHLRRERLSLQDVNTLVLDEADRMLQMGFEKTIDAIVDQVPTERQTLLFSATYPEQIQAVTRRIMHDPTIVRVDTKHDDASIEQHFFRVQDDTHRLIALRLILLQHKPDSALVFCATKRDAQRVANHLWEHGLSAVALHGDLEQFDRTRALVRFANGSVSILVATDVAARGLDIDSLDAVINFHVSRDSEVHVHRIGRTGRAGGSGVAYSLHADEESNKLKLLADYLDTAIVDEPLPPAEVLAQTVPPPEMVTLQISGGKKQKLRPGDILGALTGKQGIDGADVGKIDVFDQYAYVAVRTTRARDALRKLASGKMKGRSFRARLITDGM